MNIGDINSLEFSTLVTKVRVFLKNNLDQSEHLIKAAKEIDAMAYPLTRSDERVFFISLYS